MLRTRPGLSIGAVAIFAGLALVCLGHSATRAQGPDERRARFEERRHQIEERARHEIEQLERESRHEGMKGHPGPGGPEDAELEEATRGLTREIEMLHARIEIAESELRILHAKARLRALGADRQVREDRPRDEEARDRGTGSFYRPEREERMRRPSERGPEGREERREERGQGRHRLSADPDAIEHVLNQAIVIPFPDPTTLSDLFKYVKKSTVGDALPNGLPIYIDPRGLHRANQTMESKVQLKADEQPLKRSLEQILGQVDLRFYVKDGLVLVTSIEPADEEQAEEPDSE